MVRKNTRRKHIRNFANNFEKENIRGRERCSRVYPEKALGSFLKLRSSTKSFSPPPPHCAAATATVRISVPAKSCQEPTTTTKWNISDFRSFAVGNRESSRFKINLVNKDCRRGTEVEVGLENEEARTLDLMADFMDEIDVRAILLHEEAIDDESNRKRSKKKGLGFCFFLTGPFASNERY
ncbi:hypothetical protein VNO80_21251 [Phaseolus coccineus]|uniref:Uncharacterized protein n=1 Tax=Phaseolus coccineus TaxID=3886 RepID=A0AAN9QXI7_PHACN